MKNYFFIIFLFIFLLNKNICIAEVKILTYGNVSIDHIAWKGYEENAFLPLIFLKDSNLSIKTIYSKKLSTYINFVFNPNKIEYIIKEAYFLYKKKNFEIKIGKILPFYDLEDNIDSINRIFMEKCSLVGFEEKNLFGIMLNYKTQLSNIFYYILTPELYPDNKKTQTNKLSFFFRCFINITQNDNLLHIGFNYKEIIRNQYDKEEFTSVIITDTPFFITPYANLRTHYTTLPFYRTVGYEIINIFNAVYLQSEISFIRAGWKDFNSEFYKSIYIQIAYIITGEKHRYNFNNGIIENPIIKSNLGALEIAIRYSFNDTTSKNPLISGICKTDAKKHTINIGLNWYFNDKIKIQANYAYESFIYRLIDDKKIHSFGFGLRFSF